MSAKAGKLSPDEIAAALSTLRGWSVADGKLHREYKFRDFVEAIGFMTEASLVINALDHHPEWFNVYHTVRVDLVTHSAGGITQKDVDLAGKMEELAGRLGVH